MYTKAQITASITTLIGVFSLSLPLSPSLIHIYIHMHTHYYTHTYIHTCTAYYYYLQRKWNKMSEAIQYPILAHYALRGERHTQLHMAGGFPSYNQSTFIVPQWVQWNVSELPSIHYRPKLTHTWERERGIHMYLHTDKHAVPIIGNSCALYTTPHHGILT